MPSGNGSGSLMSSRLRMTVRSSRSMPSSRISVTAWLSSAPSSITPTTVYSGTRSGASRPSSKTLPPKRDRTCPVGGDFTAYIVPLLHTSPPPTPPRESLSQRAPREERAASPGVKSSPSLCVRSGKLVRVDTRDADIRPRAPRRARAGGLDPAQPLAPRAPVHRHGLHLRRLDDRRQLLLRPRRRAESLERRAAGARRAAAGHRARGLRRGPRRAGGRREPGASRVPRIRDSGLFALQRELLLLQARRDGRLPAHTDRAGPAGRFAERRGANLEGQARDRGHRHLPRHHPGGVGARRTPTRREHPGDYDGRHPRVLPPDLPCLLCHNRALARLRGLADLEEEQAVPRPLTIPLENSPSV